MATRKSSKPKLAAVPSGTDKPLRVANSDAMQDRNPLIGLFPDDTMDACAVVLAFLEEIHASRADDASDYAAHEDVERGEATVLRLVKHALQIQAGIRDAEGAAQ